jgi:16S rRNA (cytidine1402-2'-O)-methyltransferase
MVLLLDGTPSAAATEHHSLAAEVKSLMNAESLSEKDALKRVAKSRGLGKSEAYREFQRSKR